MIDLDMLRQINDSCFEARYRIVQGRGYLRPSSLGQPAVNLLAKKLYGCIYNPEQDLKRHMRFGLGVFAELLLAEQLMLEGYTINTVQPQFDVYPGVKGSGDFIVSKDGESTLIDCKAVSKSSYDKAGKSMSRLSQVYQTQMALYQRIWGSEAAWLYLNKNSAETKLIRFEVNPTTLSLLKRADSLCDILPKITSWKEAANFNIFTPALTDSGYVPESMMWSEYLDLFYLDLKPVGSYAYKATGVRLPDELDKMAYKV